MAAQHRSMKSMKSRNQEDLLDITILPLVSILDLLQLTNDFFKLHILVHFVLNSGLINDGRNDNVANSML